jgi:16S rRNA (cytosine967-C5)-methyltransferase
MSTSASTLPLSRLLEHSADALQAVRRGRSLTEVLAETPPAARPGVQALTYHALRHLGAADEVLRRLAPKAPAPPVAALLCVVLASCWPADRPAYPVHTLVNQAVAAARRRLPATAGFVNALLRRFLREQDSLMAAMRQSPVAVWNHPAWWIERLRRDWPEQWRPLLTAANQRAPMTLRVNLRRCSATDYVQQLAAQGREATRLEDPAFGGQAVVLAAPCPVEALPGFAQGEVSVQDASAQRAAWLLLHSGALAAGARVLDACAAPGGKSAHLLELADLDLLALDADAQRLQRVRDTLQRLDLRGSLKVGDAGSPADWWDGRPFDAILLDAPCSASGIVRRHPDIRWLRRATDIDTLAAQQSRLLESLWPLLAPGGCVLYATCSIFRAEGQDRIDAFLQRHGAAGAMLDPASPGHLLTVPDNPGTADDARSLHDGFYYALIRKT